jgi:hypothetical protein
METVLSTNFNMKDKHYKVTIKPTFLGKSTLYKCSDKTTFPKLKVKKEATVYHNIANRLSCHYICIMYFFPEMLAWLSLYNVCLVMCTFGNNKVKKCEGKKGMCTCISLMFFLPQNNQNALLPHRQKKNICAESVLYYYVPTTSSCLEMLSCHYICIMYFFPEMLAWLSLYNVCLVMCTFGILNSSSPKHVWHVKTLMIYMYTCLSFPHTFLLYYFRKCTYHGKHLADEEYRNGLQCYDIP